MKTKKAFSKKTKCKFKGCSKPANKQYTLDINRKITPLCTMHGEYLALRMMGRLLQTK